MSTLELFERTQFERTPFDILFRNFFQDQGQYVPMVEKNKVSHPVDLYETEKGLNFDIACTGISKDEIDIQLNGDILKVNYDRNDEDNKDYIYKGIAKRSFNLGWKINSRFDVSKSTAGFNDGLLTILVPFAKGSEVKTLKIK